MAQIGNCPIGFEDGHIEAYEADSEWLILKIEFWNEKHGTLRFQEPWAVHDNAAIGVILGSVKQHQSSELLRQVVVHQFEKPPQNIDLQHYQFLDLDDYPVFEVVAKACSFFPLDVNDKPGS
jgi:hypothetical protein